MIVRASARDSKYSSLHFCYMFEMNLVVCDMPCSTLFNSFSDSSTLMFSLACELFVLFMFSLRVSAEDRWS